MLTKVLGRRMLVQGSRLFRQVYCGERSTRSERAAIRIPQSSPDVPWLRMALYDSHIRTYAGKSVRCGTQSGCMRGVRLTAPPNSAARHAPRRAAVVVQARKLDKRSINKVVLAYSGGLDTSVILKWLQDTYDCEVVTFTADLGQVSLVLPSEDSRERAGRPSGPCRSARFGVIRAMTHAATT